MCLAFLESMEGTYSMNTFTALLQPLRIGMYIYSLYDILV